MALTTAQRQEIVSRYGKDSKDCGNVKVQIALITAQINQLNQHLIANRHDYSSKRGMQVLVGKRSSLIKYLKAHDVAAHKQLLEDLNIRK
jgi:small subunit ribosomal protein S15